MKNNIILIDKPYGITSFDCIREIKKQTDIRKLGHTGTLDPFAQGVLVVLTGKYTKLTNLFHKYRKSYIATFQTGYLSNTGDITGEIIQSGKLLTKNDIETIIPKYVGEIQQKPHKFSAVKINGERAYDLARAEKDFELKSKKVCIYDIKLLHYLNGFGTLRIECSTGTYIRSLIEDIAKELGSNAYTYSLIRESVGPYKIGDCSKLNNILINNLDSGNLKDLGKIITPNKEQLIKLNFGKKEILEDEDSDLIIIERNNQILTILEKTERKYKYIFNNVELINDIIKKENLL